MSAPEPVVSAALRDIFGHDECAEAGCLVVTLQDKRTGAAAAIYEQALESGVPCRIEMTPSAKYAARGYHESARRMHEDWCRRR